MTPEDLISEHQAYGVLIDTNLLMLYLIGIFDLDKLKPDRIPKRINKYSIDNFQQLKTLVSFFKHKYTTPGVLVETWNFLENMFDEQYFRSFRDFIAKEFKVYRERLLAKNDIMAEENFLELGFTDCSIQEAASFHNLLIVTDDLAAHIKFSRQGLSSLNMTNIMQGWVGV